MSSIISPYPEFCHKEKEDKKYCLTFKQWPSVTIVPVLICSFPRCLFFFFPKTLPGQAFLAEFPPHPLHHRKIFAWFPHYIIDDLTAAFSQSPCKQSYSTKFGSHDPSIAIYNPQIWVWSGIGQSHLSPRVNWNNSCLVQFMWFDKQNLWKEGKSNSHFCILFFFWIRN